MTSKDCRNTRREIDELELGQRPSGQATTHMKVCVDCRTFQAERTSLRELVGSLDPVVAPPDFDMRLRARIAAEKYDQRRQPFFARLISTPALAAAALFVVVACSVVWISRRPSIIPTPPASPVVANNLNNEPAAPATENQPNTGANTTVPRETNDLVASGPIKTTHRPRSSRSSEQYDVQPVDVIRQTDSDQAYVSSRPVEFALQDESGKTRRISLPPVSFGAQNLVGNNRTNASYSPSSRVW